MATKAPKPKKDAPAKAASAPKKPTPKQKYTIKGGQVSPKYSLSKASTPKGPYTAEGAKKVATAPKPSPTTPGEKAMAIQEAAAKARKEAAAKAKATAPAPKVAPAAPKATPSPAVGPAKKAGSNLANDVGRALGKLKNISRGKGLLGLASAAVIGSGLYQTNKIKSKSSPAKASTASSASNFNKGKDPIQQYGVKNPTASTVVKKPAAPAPKPAASVSKPAAPSTKTVGGSKSSPSKIRKPDSFSRKNIAKDLSAKTVGVKSSSPIGKTPEGVVKNVSLSRPSSTASKSSASPLSKRATMKGLRKEKRSERKLSRQARRENRIINKTAKLKAKR